MAHRRQDTTSASSSVMPCTLPRIRSSHARTGLSESARESSPDRRTPASIPGRPPRPGGFLADMVAVLEHQARRFAGARFPRARFPRARFADGAGRSHARRQPRDWRDGLLRPAIACVVFAIGVALAVAPLRQAFLQLSSAVGITSHSSTGVQGGTGSGSAMGSSAGGVSPSSISSSEGRLGARR